MDASTLYRNVLLRTADAGLVRNFVTRFGWRLGVGRFVAGESIEAALPTLQRIEASGKRLVLDQLGEFVRSESAARDIAAKVRHAVRTAAEAGVEPYLSVKPTQIGLAIDPELAFELAGAVAETVRSVSGHLCLDMENVPHVDATLDLYERLHAAGFANVSTVLQAYLHRTPEDLERVMAVRPQHPLRLVKGAYREPPEAALQAKAEVDGAFRDLAYRAFEAGMQLNLATHDDRLLRELLAFARGAGLGASRYEIQMLFGVRPALQDRLAAEGHVMRVYVPFGPDWYGYYSRRLAERPANLALVVRGMFG
ncbi:MAG: proline dehydrogenase family protein [Trueperaceae bacterium]